jgi:hypothetical protein
MTPIPYKTHSKNKNSQVVIEINVSLLFGSALHNDSYANALLPIDKRD